MKKLKKINFAFFFITFLSLFFLFHPKSGYAQTQNWENISERCVNNDVATIQGLSCLIANILSVTLTLIGLAGFVMLIIGSLRWLLSGGSSQNIESAKKTMTWAIIGLILALSSFVIINILAEFTGVNVIREFFIPDSNVGLPGETQWEDII